MNTNETQTLNRTGQPPLRFTGTLIASENGRGTNDTRWSIVSLYRTKGGKIIVYVESITQWQGESSYYKGRSVTTAQEAIDYLKDDEGHIGRTSQRAIEKAVDVDPEFAAAWVESVD